LRGVGDFGGFYRKFSKSVTKKYFKYCTVTAWIIYFSINRGKYQYWTRLTFQYFLHKVFADFRRNSTLVCDPKTIVDLAYVAWIWAVQCTSLHPVWNDNFFREVEGIWDLPPRNILSVFVRGIYFNKIEGKSILVVETVTCWFWLGRYSTKTKIE
jgi:hypothetical protein